MNASRVRRRFLKLRRYQARNAGYIPGQAEVAMWNYQYSYLLDGKGELPSVLRRSVQLLRHRYRGELNDSYRGIRGDDACRGAVPCGSCARCRRQQVFFWAYERWGCRLFAATGALHRRPHGGGYEEGGSL